MTLNGQQKNKKMAIFNSIVLPSRLLAALIGEMEATFLITKSVKLGLDTSDFVIYCEKRERERERDGYIHSL